MNMVLTETGAASAVAKALPDLTATPSQTPDALAHLPMIDGFAQLGYAQVSPVFFSDKQYQYAANGNWTKGAHSVRFGGEKAEDLVPFERKTLDNGVTVIVWGTCQFAAVKVTGVGFWFFLIKGLLWLTVPLGAAWLGGIGFALKQLGEVQHLGRALHAHARLLVGDRRARDGGSKTATTLLVVNAYHDAIRFKKAKVVWDRDVLADTMYALNNSNLKLVYLSGYWFKMYPQLRPVNQFVFVTAVETKLQLISDNPRHLGVITSIS